MCPSTLQPWPAQTNCKVLSRTEGIAAIVSVPSDAELDHSIAKCRAKLQEAAQPYWLPKRWLLSHMTMLRVLLMKPERGLLSTSCRALAGARAAVCTAEFCRCEFAINKYAKHGKAG